MRTAPDLTALAVAVRVLVRFAPAALALVAFAPAAAAQTAPPAARRAVDVQGIGEGFSVSGAGLRLWLRPTTSLRVSLAAQRTWWNPKGPNSGSDPSDVTEAMVSASVGVERHVRPEARVHPYVAADVMGMVGYQKQGLASEGQLGWGVQAAVGAEARLFEGLSISGEYGVSFTRQSGYNLYDATQLALGGAPRVALSLRF